MSKLPWMAKQKQWSLRGGKFYHTTTWRNLRASHLKDNPLCVECLKKGITKEGNTVDHITEVNKGGSPIDPSNLQTLCASCHGRKNKHAY